MEHCFCQYLKNNIPDIRLIPLDYVTIWHFLYYFNQNKQISMNLQCHTAQANVSLKNVYLSALSAQKVQILLPFAPLPLKIYLANPFAHKKNQVLVLSLPAIRAAI